MLPRPHRTKIVATIGPASNSPEVARQMLRAGMSVARLNFSHGSYEDHARTVQVLRAAADELDVPLALLQDLQGPKVRVGQLPDGKMLLEPGAKCRIVPLEIYNGEPDVIPIDYPHVAEEAEPDTQILLDDGRLELRIVSIDAPAVICEVERGGILKNRKGVNFPSLNLRLPSMTEKDCRDLEFGISQNVDWVALSFVREAEDIRQLKRLLAEKGAKTPVIAKIEKPQAIDHLEEIVAECDGLMVARGDLGVEMHPEKVPMLQKRIIRACNQKGIPAITATQMLESMIENANPTRAEASDVANAIIDGTSAVMLSGESAVGKYPVQSVEMLAKIATEVEPFLEFVNLPPAEVTETHALSEALSTIDKILPLRWIAAFTTTGFTARLAAAERLKTPIVAFTPDQQVYHSLNLLWGVTPIYLKGAVNSVEVLVYKIEAMLRQRHLVAPGDRLVILGGSPVQATQGTNFLKLHDIGEETL
ncbi:MAG: pyruvate kinase [Spirulinaceae cyanobacterium RM2_2_10]|nr:pyruvate kinase [Spirulinaceae cyanobacterium SM2_1_0]NJO19698.1 pyruvate kinase [Spirulinaceae cyanobacterium RM2_2_10]